MGCMYQEYATLLTDGGMKLTAATATGNSLAFMVGRVSYTFGLAGEVGRVFATSNAQACGLSALGVAHACSSRFVAHPLCCAGPCISTDTACSSSLVAAHLAHTGLERVEAASAVAAGVNLMLSPVTTVAICQLQVSPRALLVWLDYFNSSTPAHYGANLHHSPTSPQTGESSGSLEALHSDIGRILLLVLH